MKTLTTSLLLASVLVLAPGCGGDDGADPSDATTADAATADAATGDRPITARFQPLADTITEELEELGAPGAAVLVMEHGVVTFAHGFGTTHPTGDQPVHASTQFRIGSVTKMLTAAVLLGALDEGGATLADPISDVVPELAFELDASWAPAITLDHLLTHASGLYDYLVLDTPSAEREDAALDSFLTGPFETFEYVMAPPGRMWNYSNPNFYLAGLAIERLTGATYRAAMAERLFAPLGMADTTFLAADVLARGDVASGRSTGPSGAITIGPADYENAWGRPAGYAFSTVLDLARFVTFLADGDVGVLADAPRLAMVAPQRNTDILGDLYHYGHGLFVHEGFNVNGVFHATRLVEHGGDIDGFAADVYWVPSAEFVFISLASADGAHLERSAALALSTLAELGPASAPPASLTVDPAAFPAYAGTYQDDFNAGRIDVTVGEEGVRLSMPDIDAAGLPYTPLLTPVSPGSFVLAIQGTRLLVTFLVGDDGVAYLRTRAFVARRTPVEPPPVAVRVDPVRLRRAAELDRATLRWMPVPAPRD